MQIHLQTQFSKEKRLSQTQIILETLTPRKHSTGVWISKSIKTQFPYLTHALVVLQYKKTCFTCVDLRMIRDESRVCWRCSTIQKHTPPELCTAAVTGGAGDVHWWLRSVFWRRIYTQLLLENIWGEGEARLGEVSFFTHLWEKTVDFSVKI